MSYYDIFILDFSSSTHPLAVVLKDAQEKVRKVTQPIYEEYHQLIQEHISVPYEYNDIELSDTEALQIGNTLTEETDEDEFERNLNTASEQVKTAIYKTDDAIASLENPGLGGAGVEVDKEEEDEMDSLFDSDEDINEQDGRSQGEAAGLVDSHKPDNRLTDYAKQDVVEKLNDVEELSEVFKQQLANITESLHAVMYTLSTLVPLAYESLKCDIGSDIVHAAIQECTFPGINEELQFLYR